MQIVISRQDLLSVLKRSAGAINPTDMVSVRQCVFIDASGPPNELSFTGTNGQIDIIITAKGEVKRGGSAALNHRRLMALVNELPEGHVELSVDQKFKTTIRSSASKRKFSMTALDASDFPPVDSDQPEALYTVEAKILLQAANEVAFAIDAKGERLPAGALLTPTEGAMFELAAVDGYVLAVAKGWFTERGSASECLLPRNLLEAMRGIPKDHTLSITKNQNKVFVRSPDMSISANQCHQPFPGSLVRTMVASMPTKRRFRVSSEAFLESVHAIGAASEFVEGKDKAVQVDLTCSNGVVVLSTRKSESTEGEDELAVSEAEVSSYAIHFNATPMSSALKSFVPTDVDFYFDVVSDRPVSFLKSETLLASVMLIDDIPAPPVKSHHK